ncbi:hypothetical protein M3Y96_00363900 [Aphelenchoides besseyi]|nr:hypothetical protein M3Y96_00363900 [Aphelenchoides besseyi]
MVGPKFFLFATMGKSFGSGVIVWIFVLLVARMIEAKCLDGNKITGGCKELTLSVKSNSAEIKATMKIKQSAGEKSFPGNITIGSCTFGGLFLPAGENFNPAYKTPIQILATKNGVEIKDKSHAGWTSICSTSPFKLGVDGKAATNFAVHTDRADFVEIDLVCFLFVISIMQIPGSGYPNRFVERGEDKLLDNHRIILLIFSLAGFAWYKCHKKTKIQETPAKNEKPLAEVVVAPLAKKETPVTKKATSWVYASNAEIARSSRSREIARRKSLPGRLTLHQISRKIHQTNSANALKKMKAAKLERDNSAKKLEAAQAKHKNTIKLLERVKKELVEAKEALDRKMKVSAEIAALGATTPQVQSKLLKLGPTQSETATAREISPRATTPQATTPQAKTIQTTTTRATTDVTTEATTEEPTTAAQTTDDTRSGI